MYCHKTMYTFLNSYNYLNLFLNNYKVVMKEKNYNYDKLDHMNRYLTYLIYKLVHLLITFQHN